MAATLRILTRAGRFIGDSVLALGVLWAVGLLVFQPVCIIPAVVLAAVAVWIAYRRKERLLRTWLWVFFLLSLLMYQLLPNPQGPWQQPWRHLPECSLDGDILTVRNLRNFSYTTEDDFHPATKPAPTTSPPWWAQTTRNAAGAGTGKSATPW